MEGADRILGTAHREGVCGCPDRRVHERAGEDLHGEGCQGVVDGDASVLPCCDVVLLSWEAEAHHDCSSSSEV